MDRVAHAQQPAATSAQTLIVSPLVGETIDLKEKKMYGLFLYYSADTFQEARFMQYSLGDSTSNSINLRTTFRNGEVKQRLFTKREFQELGQAIETRHQELQSYPASALQIASNDSLRGTYSVELLSGASFIGKLVAQRETELDFMTKDLGRLTVNRANIRRIQLLSATQSRLGWEPLGNGTRIFFAPTARPLRKGEGYIQNIDIILLGASYGITDNISVGVLVPIVPGVGINVFAVTPKIGFQVREKLHVGGGVLYANAFGDGGGVGYGVATYGSADSNVTLGLGYGFAAGDLSSSPVVVVGGATRISRRISLLNETYIYDGGLAGLFGLRVGAARLSGSLGVLYATDLDQIIPAYAEVVYRFGKVK